MCVCVCVRACVGRPLGLSEVLGIKLSLCGIHHSVIYCSVYTTCHSICVCVREVSLGWTSSSEVQLYSTGAKDTGSTKTEANMPLFPTPTILLSPAVSLYTRCPSHLGGPSVPVKPTGHP